jgi:hypothetical protein
MIRGSQVRVQVGPPSTSPERATLQFANRMRSQCSVLGVSFNHAEERVHEVQQVGRRQKT